ncbi:hypothetical protein IH980_05370 [Patescibacteria group bacterium]|nr:hypothetical protein [Patescibacteria group bacterium]
MARVSVKKPLAFEDEQRLLEKLFLALSSLGNWQEAEAFLVEFLTKEELAMLAKRLELYKRIQQKQRYREIMRALHVTAQTVSEARKKMKRAGVYFERILRKLQTLDRRLG